MGGVERGAGGPRDGNIDRPPDHQPSPSLTTSDRHHLAMETYNHGWKVALAASRAELRLDTGPQALRPMHCDGWPDPDRIGVVVAIPKASTRSYTIQTLRHGHRSSISRWLPPCLYSSWFSVCQNAPKPTSRPTSIAVSSYRPTRWCRGPATYIVRSSTARYEDIFAR